MKLKLLMKLSQLIKYIAYCEGYDYGYSDGYVDADDDLEEDGKVEDE